MEPRGQPARGEDVGAVALGVAVEALVEERDHAAPGLLGSAACLDGRDLLVDGEVACEPARIGEVGGRPPGRDGVRERGRSDELHADEGIGLGKVLQMRGELLRRKRRNAWAVGKARAASPGAARSRTSRWPPCGPRWRQPPCAASEGGRGTASGRSPRGRHARPRPRSGRSPRRSRAPRRGGRGPACGEGRQLVLHPLEDERRVAGAGPGVARRGPPRPRRACPGCRRPRSRAAGRSSSPGGARPSSSRRPSRRPAASGARCG